jgi:hypothetical protein
VPGVDYFKLFFSITDGEVFYLARQLRACLSTRTLPLSTLARDYIRFLVMVIFRRYFIYIHLNLARLLRAYIRIYMSVHVCMHPVR